MRFRCLTLFLLFSAITTVSNAQTIDSLWHGYLSPIVQTGGSAPNFEFQGAFNSTAGFTGAQIDLAQSPRLVFYSNNQCYEFPITDISSSGSIIAGTVHDPSGKLSALPSGTAAIYVRSGASHVAPHVTGVSNALQSCIQTNTNLVLDSLKLDSTALSMLRQDGATPDQVIKWDGTQWAPGVDAGGISGAVGNGQIAVGDGAGVTSSSNLTWNATSGVTVNVTGSSDPGVKITNPGNTGNSNPTVVLQGTGTGGSLATVFTTSATSSIPSISGFYTNAANGFAILNGANGKQIFRAGQTGIIAFNGLSQPVANWADLDLYTRFKIIGDFNLTFSGKRGARMSLTDGYTFTDNGTGGAIGAQSLDYHGRGTLAGANARTVTNAATVYVEGNPIAGSNTTITNPWSIFVESGNSKFQGTVMADDFRLSGSSPSTTNGAKQAMVWTGNGSAATPAFEGVVSGSGAANRVGLWNGTASQSSDANLTFDGTNLVVGDVNTNSWRFNKNGSMFNVSAASSSYNNIIAGDYLGSSDTWSRSDRWYDLGAGYPTYIDEWEGGLWTNGSTGGAGGIPTRKEVYTSGKWDIYSGTEYDSTNQCRMRFHNGYFVFNPAFANNDQGVIDIRVSSGQTRLPFSIRNNTLNRIAGFNTNGTLFMSPGAGAGKVLTSDGSGNASWAALPSTAPKGGPGSVFFANTDSSATHQREQLYFRPNTPGVHPQLRIGVNDAFAAMYPGIVNSASSCILNWSNYWNNPADQPYWNAGYVNLFGTHSFYEFDNDGMRMQLETRYQDNGTGIAAAMPAGYRPVIQSIKYNVGSGANPATQLYDWNTFQAVAVDGSGNPSFDNVLHYQVPGSSSSHGSNYDALRIHHTTGNLTFKQYANTRNDAGAAVNVLSTTASGQLVSNPVSEILAQRPDTQYIVVPIVPGAAALNQAGGTILTSGFLRLSSKFAGYKVRNVAYTFQTAGTESAKSIQLRTEINGIGQADSEVTFNTSETRKEVTTTASAYTVSAGDLYRVIVQTNTFTTDHPGGLNLELMLVR